MMQAIGIDCAGHEVIVRLPAYEPLTANLILTEAGPGHPGIVGRPNRSQLGFLASLAVQGIRVDREKSGPWMYVLIGENREQYWMQMEAMIGFMRVPTRGERKSLTVYFETRSRLGIGTGEIFGKLTEVEGMPSNPGRAIFSPVPFNAKNYPQLPEVEGGRLLEAIKLFCLFPGDKWTHRKLQHSLGGISDEHTQDLLATMSRIGVITRSDDGYSNSFMSAQRFEETFGVMLPK